MFLSLDPIINTVTLVLLGFADAGIAKLRYSWKCLSLKAKENAQGIVVHYQWNYRPKVVNKTLKPLNRGHLRGQLTCPMFIGVRCIEFSCYDRYFRCGYFWCFKWATQYIYKPKKIIKCGEGSKMENAFKIKHYFFQ